MSPSELSGAGPPQGAKAPSGGSDPHAVGETGGMQFFDGPPLEKLAPSGGSDPHAVGKRGGHILRRAAGKPDPSPGNLGG